MSHLASQLRHLMEKRGLTQLGLAEKTGISQAAISRYLSSDNRPRTTAAAEKLIRAFSAHRDRADLIAAHVRDSIPVRMRDQVQVQPNYEQGTQPEPRAHMPKDLRDAFEKLERAALDRAGVADFIITSAKLL